jgi:N-acyl-D-aspartate/D-glutamate deacylase
MKCIERFDKYRDEDFDRVLLLIKNGTIKCGKYADLVKIDKDKTIKDKKEYFNDNSSTE